MKLLQQKVEAKEVLRMIDARLESVTMSYRYAQGDNNKIDANVMAETKWQLAEFKMQFAELLLEQTNKALEDNK